MKYDESIKEIVAYMNDGTEKRYGNPFAGAPDGGKSEIAINGCLNEGFKPACTPYTAAAHTRCIEAIQAFPIFDVNPELIRADGALLYVDGLDRALEECYEKEILLRDTDFYNKLIAR